MVDLTKHHDDDDDHRQPFVQCAHAVVPTRKPLAQQTPTAAKLDSQQTTRPVTGSTPVASSEKMQVMLYARGGVWVAY
jgi:hypothetical protein